MTVTRSRIRLNFRGLTQILLICVCVTLWTLAGWRAWQTEGGRVAALDHTQTVVQSSGHDDTLIPRILNHPGMITAAALTEFVLILALFLGIAPPTWWLRTQYPRLPGEPEVPENVDTPLKWLGDKLSQVQTPRGPVPAAEAAPALPGDPTSAQSSEMPTGLDPAQPVPGQPAPNQPAPGQPVPGQPAPGQAAPAQPTAGQPPMLVQPVAGQQTPGSSPADPSAPGASPTAHAPGAPPPPPPPLTDVLQFTEESDPLADLTDIKDILSSAFDEDHSLDPDREALSRSLDEVPIQGLVTMTRGVAAAFRPAPIRRAQLV